MNITSPHYIRLIISCFIIPCSVLYRKYFVCIPINVTTHSNFKSGLNSTETAQKNRELSRLITRELRACSLFFFTVFRSVSPGQLVELYWPHSSLLDGIGRRAEPVQFTSSGILVLIFIFIDRICIHIYIQTL